ARNETAGGQVPSGQVFHDMRADHIGNRDRQALPARDQQTEFGAVGFQRRQRAAMPEPVMPVMLYRACSPLFFEFIGAGIDSGAAKIEMAVTALDTKPQHVPV